MNVNNKVCKFHLNHIKRLQLSSAPNDNLYRLSDLVNLEREDRGVGGGIGGENGCNLNLSSANSENTSRKSVTVRKNRGKPPTRLNL